MEKYEKNKRFETLKNKSTKIVDLLLEEDDIFIDEIDALIELIKNELKFKVFK